MAVLTGFKSGFNFSYSNLEIASAIESYVPGNNRSQVKESSLNTVICDSYNANPESMRRAIESFMETKADKKLIILGDMLELGTRTNEEHMGLLRNLNSQGILDVLLVGELFSALAGEFGYKSFRNVDDLAEYLKINPISGHHILVKGSRGLMLEKIYDLI